MCDIAPGALAAYGWSERVHRQFLTALAERPTARSASAHAVPLTPARITRIERVVCLAAFPDGDERVLRAPALPAVGDWVLSDGERVAHVLPRGAVLARADPDGRGVQTLAANVDRVIVVVPADRARLARVERELTLAWDSGATPLVALAKADLDPDGACRAELELRAPGVEVLATSARSGSGVDALRGCLAPDRTGVLLGPSGAGKSSLVNLLLGRQALAVGEVRESDHRGRHTTTSRHLLALPGGGVVIDTPGLRSLGLAGDVDLAAGFPDVEALAARCRFADCRHAGEPGCAVTDALARGALDPERLDSYRRLEREAAFERRRHDPLAAREDRRRWAARSREGRARRNDRS